MKWRLIDQMESFAPWRGLTGYKTISFEEYSLLKIFGRKGAFPEALLLEACVELARWLVAASSAFTQVGVLDTVEGFKLLAEAGRGGALHISVTVMARDEKSLQLDCRVQCVEKRVASGRITVALQPLAESFDKEWVAGLWRELQREEHAQA